MLELQRQLALDPNLIPEPSSEGAAGIGSLLTRLCSVSALAAFLAWTLVTYSSVKKTTENAAANSATVAIANHRINVIGVESSQLHPITAQAHIATSKPRPAKIAVADAGVIAPAVPAEPAATPTAPQRGTERRELRLDGEEIAIMIKRAKDLLGNGDVAAARLLLRRAAEAGSAEGAFTLGATFDPVSLQRLGAIGAVPDLAKARQWYQRAAELGSNAASQQLAGLGNAP
jgi:TPR repeat protein